MEIAFSPDDGNSPVDEHDSNAGRVSILDRPAYLADLILAVQKGCEQSFATLYLQTSAELFGVILRISRHSSEAEEILQEAYIKAWRQSGQFDARQGAVLSWLKAIARNCAIDRQRRSNSHPRTFLPGYEGDPYHGLPSHDRLPQDLAIQARFSDAVNECMGTLSGEQCQSLKLAFREGLTYSEIAIRLGKPIGTVKSLIRRALLVLRVELASYQ